MPNTISKNGGAPARWVTRAMRQLWMAAACVGVAVMPAFAAASTLEVALIAGDEAPELDAGRSLEQLRASLQSEPGTRAELVAASRSGGISPALAPLRTADAAVIYGGGGVLAPEDAAILRDFLVRGKGVLVLRAAPGGWAAGPDFGPQLLGAKPQGVFAKGAAMQVINLFGHAIFTGVERLETDQPMPLYAELAPDAQLVIEGTVGEATAPLGWLRSRGPARMAHLVPASRALFAEPGYLRLLANTIRWVAHRPIPGARALVQRTYLPDAYPGAVTVTFPDGPTAGFDPTRGGVSQIADGDFVDLRPRWLTKQGQPARMAGNLFFQDAGRALFWSGADGAEPKFQFNGYSVKERFPEFFYRVGDRAIREQVRPMEQGIGLIRELHVGAGMQAISYRCQIQPGAEILVSGGTGAASPDRFEIAAGPPAVVRIEIRPRQRASP